jgi:Flp pilus assembly protein TadB
VNIGLAGAIATTLGVICLVLVPFGAPKVFATRLTHPERSVLSEAGWTRSMLEWECLRGVVTISALALAASLGLLPIGLLGAVLPSVVARTRAARRRDDDARETVALLQMTVAGLRSGASLTEALRLATRSGHQPVFDGALRSFDLGAPLDVALRAARGESHDHRVTLGLDALSLCVAEQLPASRCATVIAGAVDRLVFEQRMVDEMRSRTSGLRAQIVLLAALVPGLALYLSITVPGMVETLATPLGRFVLLPLAAVLEAAGILASRRVVQDFT